MLSNLFWIYLINLILLIVHEIDSAYWQEWKLFHLPGGIQAFVLLHIPLLFILLLGLIGVYERWQIGLVLSFAEAIAGIAAFAIHQWFLHKGHSEFNNSVSRGVLWLLLIVSLGQIAMTSTMLQRY